MRVWRFVQDYSLLLIIGAVIALFWANTDPHSYHHLIEHPIWANDIVGAPYDYWVKAYGKGAAELVAPGPERVLSLHYLVNDVLMALFFAFAGKEVWEAIALKNGSLRGRKAATPLFATAGGVIVPVAIYFLGAMLIGRMSDLSQGWAIPTATDIAFSYLVGRLIFGARHPAVTFLLLLAIADDAIGLAIIAIFYSKGELQPLWLVFSLGCAVASYVLFNWLPRRLDRGKQDRPVSTWMREKFSFWPFMLAGCFSWYGFQEAGVHPALGLMPIIPAMPHAEVAFGIFAAAEKYLDDTLNAFEHTLKVPVEIILFLFGFANAGVEMSAIGAATWLVLAGLFIGKPLGIWGFGQFAYSVLGLGLPDGMRPVDLIVVGFISAIGFTVALFVAGVAFDPGPLQDAAKMGALLSLGASILAIVAGKLCRIKKID